MPNQDVILCFLPDAPDFYIVHECVHAAFALTEMLGIDDEESICYFTEYLFKQIKDNV